MTAPIGNNENAERGLLPYPLIIAATKDDPKAMAIVVKHYESYIASLSMRRARQYLLGHRRGQAASPFPLFCPRQNLSSTLTKKAA